MTSIKRQLNLFLVLTLAMFGTAFAQEAEDAFEIGGEESVAIGGIEVSEPEPFDAGVEDVDVAVETGAIIFTAETPGEQHPNVDLVGPDGYFEHLEIEDDDEQVVEGLLPGVYSVAATDDELQLAHSLVEVLPGQATSVNIMLNDAALAGFENAELLADDRFVYPDDAYEVGEPVAFDNDEFGAVAVETDNEDANFIVTGPDGYSEEFEGAFTAENLLPGLYVVAGTEEGAQIATSTFRVDVATATTLVPVFDVFTQTEPVEGGVAGGGEAIETEPVEADEPVDAEAADEGADEEVEDIDPVEEFDPAEEPVDDAAADDEGL